ncbi:B-type flagellin [Mobiluncus mulieris]|uniref:Flagellin n=4 Tax=Mobiluncus mulieris TaxID=2052 RepID=A0A8G2HW16_9ACTO|nr:flagellin [Mobiluncus mulieris]STO16608.1 B-type flagellin [Mobiluncus mulieris]
MAVLPGSGSGWVSILGMLRLLFHPTGMCKMPGQGVLVGLAKSLEKLSSGFRINRAADDAAGLAISEGLRSQVGGNRQAVRNAQDGISLVQTAEGALNEVHSILQRMRVLAVQGANDSNSDAARKNINTELNQLQQELDRIGKVTNFNGTSLLNGSASGTKALRFQVGANGDDDNRITVDLKDCDVTAIAKFSKPTGKSSNVYSATTGEAIGQDKYVLDFEGKKVELDFTAAAPKDAKELRNKLAAALKAAGVSGYVDGGEVKATADAAVDVKEDAVKAKKWKLTIDGVSIDYTTEENHATKEVVAQKLDALIATKPELKDKYHVTYDKAKGFTVEALGDAKNTQVTVKFETEALAGGGAAVGTFMDDTIGLNTKGDFKFTVGDDKKITIARADGEAINLDLDHAFSKAVKTAAAATASDAIVSFDAYDKGGKKLKQDEYLAPAGDASVLTVMSHAKAQELITLLDAKIGSVSTARSNIGAIQNRFEHTITNLNVAVENLAASESRIRDTDMAQEMMQFTRNQILSQAGTSMLAQANQVPQGVLSLLR